MDREQQELTSSKGSAHDSSVPQLNIASLAASHDSSRESVIEGFINTTLPIVKELNLMISWLEGNLKSAIIEISKIQSFSVKTLFYPYDSNSENPPNLDKLAHFQQIFCAIHNVRIVNPPITFEGTPFQFFCDSHIESTSDRRYANKGAKIKVIDYLQYDDISHLLMLNAYYLPYKDCLGPSERNCFEELATELLKAANIQDPLYYYLENMIQLIITIAKDALKNLRLLHHIINTQWNHAKAIWPQQVFSHSLPEAKLRFEKQIAPITEWLTNDTFYDLLRKSCNIDISSSRNNEAEPKDLLIAIELFLFQSDISTQEWHKNIHPSVNEQTETINTLTKQSLNDLTKLLARLREPCKSRLPKAIERLDEEYLRMTYRGHHSGRSTSRCDTNQTASPRFSSPQISARRPKSAEPESGINPLSRLSAYLLSKSSDGSEGTRFTSPRSGSPFGSPQRSPRGSPFPSPRGNPNDDMQRQPAPTRMQHLTQEKFDPSNTPRLMRRSWRKK